MWYALISNKIMNSKASKMQIQLPPMLNMSNNKTYIDPSMRNWEKVNAPYLNEMLSPLYFRENGVEGVYDKDGNKHGISTGDVDPKWSINGEIKKTVLNGFKATEKEGDFLAAAYESDTLWVVRESTNNTLVVTNGTVSYNLAKPGTIVDIKLYFNLNTTRILSIMYKDVNNTTRIRVYEYNSVKFDKPAVWRRQILAATNGLAQVDIADSTLNPICNISNFGSGSGSYMLSYVNKYGEVLDSRYNGFITFIIDGSTIYELGDNLTINPNLQIGHLTRTTNCSYFTNFHSDVPASSLPADGQPYYKAKGINSNTYTQIEYAIYLPISETDSDSENYVRQMTGTTSAILRNRYSLMSGYYRFMSARDSVGNELGVIFISKVEGNIYGVWGDYREAKVKFFNDSTNMADLGWKDAESYNNALYTGSQVSPITVASVPIADLNINNYSYTTISKPASVEDYPIYYRSLYNRSRFIDILYELDDEDMAIRDVDKWYDQEFSAEQVTKFTVSSSRLYSDKAYGTLDSAAVEVKNTYDNDTYNTGFTITQDNNTWECTSNFENYNMPTEYQYRAGALASWVYYADENGDALHEATLDVIDAQVGVYPESFASDVVSLTPWGQTKSQAITRDTYDDTVEEALATPVITIGDNYMYAFYGFQQSTTTWVYMPAGKTIVLKGRPAISGGQLTFTDTSSVLINNYKYAYRSNSFIIEQNFYAHAGKFSYSPNDTSVPSKLAAEGVTQTNSSSDSYFEFYMDNLSAYPRWKFGSSRWSGFNYYSDFILKGSTDGHAEDRLVYNTIGSRCQLPNSNFHVLYNTTTAAATPMQGISYTRASNYIGTLVTPWQTVNNSFYIAARNNKCFYKTSDGRFIEIEANVTPTLKPILGGRFILCNTSSIDNLYSVEDGKFYHFASDWNFRCLFGQDTKDGDSPLQQGIYVTKSRLVAASQNNLLTIATSRSNFSQLSLSPVGSLQLPYYSKARVKVGDESLRGAKSSSVDIYYSRQQSTATDASTAYYQYTWTDGSLFTTYELLNSSYLIGSASSSYLNGYILADFLDGAGNNDMIVDGNSVYALHYYNNSPTFIYGISTELNRASDFFVIQGQFYAIIDDKLCSVMYNNGVLASKDPIIDVTGLKFIGNNPMIAFFWSERYRAFYSFTGDANLDFIYAGSKFSNVGGLHFYDESTQSIFVPTNRGLLVFAPRNTYLLEQFTNTSMVMFSDDGTTHIEDDGKDYSMRYYSTDEFTVNELDLESSFYGIGSTEDTTIDRWNITFYDLDGTHPTGEIIVGVRSITDIAVKSEEKKIKVTPDMWDKWSNGLLISYSPKLIKGQGIRLYVKSPYIIQQLTAHVADVGTGTLVNKRASV